MQPGFPGDPTDNQAVFDFVLAFLTEQGEGALAPADDGDPARCKYRFYGKCCAAGCLIPNADYNLDWDCEGGQFVGSKLTNLASAYFADRGFDCDLLGNLQDDHDQAALGSGQFLESLHRAMADTAYHFDLKFTPPASGAA